MLCIECGSNECADRMYTPDNNSHNIVLCARCTLSKLQVRTWADTIKIKIFTQIV